MWNFIHHFNPFLQSGLFSHLVFILYRVKIMKEQLNSWKSCKNPIQLSSFGGVQTWCVPVAWEQSQRPPQDKARLVHFNSGLYCSCIGTRKLDRIGPLTIYTAQYAIVERGQFCSVMQSSSRKRAKTSGLIFFINRKPTLDFSFNSVASKWQSWLFWVKSFLNSRIVVLKLGVVTPLGKSWVHSRGVAASLILPSWKLASWGWAPLSWIQQMTLKWKVGGNPS